MNVFYMKTLIPKRGVIVCAVGVSGDKISFVEETPPDLEKTIKLDGILIPGFIDEHIHGAGGADTMDATKSALETISKTLAKEGVTSFLATTMTESKENIKSALSNIGENVGKNLGGANLLGANLEGPFISEKRCGAQNKEHIFPVNRELFDELKNVSCETIKMVTYAPEFDTDGEFAKYLSSNGIVASIGHSDAKFSDVEKAIRSGATCVTHVFNAQSPFHHREIGVAGSSLLFDELNAELIFDLIHVSTPAGKLLVHSKPSSGVILITDSIRAKGTNESVTELGGQKVYISGERATLSDGTIAGSILKMNNAVKNIVKTNVASFEDAVRFATENPAKNLSIFDTCGSIEVGKRADLTVIDNDFNILLTMVGGKIVYLDDKLKDIDLQKVKTQLVKKGKNL